MPQPCSCSLPQRKCFQYFTIKNQIKRVSLYSYAFHHALIFDFMEYFSAPFPWSWEFSTFNPIMWITRIDFLMLNQSSSSMINSTLSWCVVRFGVCWINLIIILDFYIYFHKWDWLYNFYFQYCFLGFGASVKPPFIKQAKEVPSFCYSLWEFLLIVEFLFPWFLLELTNKAIWA